MDRGEMHFHNKTITHGERGVFPYHFARLKRFNTKYLKDQDDYQNLATWYQSNSWETSNVPKQLLGDIKCTKATLGRHQMYQSNSWETSNRNCKKLNLALNSDIPWRS
ncbi:hypothetical protein Bpfe_019425 [Biomphalaria pfeifferi]|uniref:Uncharacterized protein n=1 Tax=Biomphalaria pfeifferi TaxID=112525 RepID=A0AAD8BAJ4_BIOPF|nr:hypothetical protein Bpfe_019425 [Biomphalaria pfeifferi]